MFMVKQVNGFLAVDVGFERYWFVGLMSELVLSIRGGSSDSVYADTPKQVGHHGASQDRKNPAQGRVFPDT